MTTEAVTTRHAEVDRELAEARATLAQFEERLAALTKKLDSAISAENFLEAGGMREAREALTARIVEQRKRVEECRQAAGASRTQAAHEDAFAEVRVLTAELEAAAVELSEAERRVASLRDRLRLAEAGASRRDTVLEGWQAARAAGL